MIYYPRITARTKTLLSEKFHDPELEKCVLAVRVNIFWSADVCGRASANEKYTLKIK